MLHQELTDARAEIAQMKKDHAVERADMQRQVTRLSEEVSKVRAQNAVMKAEINRLQEGQASS
jgi:cell division protein FtsB